MAKRIVMRVRRTRDHVEWCLVGVPATPPLRFKTQAQAIQVGSAKGRKYLSWGRLAQLVVHGQDGRIRFERTYGADPVRFKG
jgi:hypothetical protein